MLKEVRFRFTHANCWLQETTERHPEVTLVISSVYQVDQDIHIDLFVHAPTRELVDASLREWQADKRVKKVSKLYDGPKGTRFHVSYTAKHSIYPHIIHHTPVSLGSINMANGVEYYSILGESEDVENLLKVLNKEGESKVTSIRSLADAMNATTDVDSTGLLASLTDKQIEALVLAHAEGYYNWPRVLSASDLADRVGLSSAAFLDHLRRAEAKALDAIILHMKKADPARIEGVKARITARRKAVVSPKKAV